MRNGLRRRCASLGLLRKADDALVFPNKNAQAAFSGLAVELAPFCGRDVEVDGLLITDPDLGSKNIYLVQKIRTLGDTEWTAANRWTKEWAKAKGKGPWFCRDPRIKAAIAAHGYTGIGAEVEKPFIKEWFE
ncbi:MAG: hypothetical protein RQ750_09985 [Roseovarius sp.]|nr:hypothetical protein [Roseovarius sp.]